MYRTCRSWQTIWSLLHTPRKFMRKSSGNIEYDRQFSQRKGHFLSSSQKETYFQICRWSWGAQSAPGTIQSCSSQWCGKLPSATSTYAYYSIRRLSTLVRDWVCWKHFARKPLPNARGSQCHGCFGQTFRQARKIYYRFLNDSLPHSLIGKLSSQLLLVM